MARPEHHNHFCGNLLWYLWMDYWLFFPPQIPPPKIEVISESSSNTDVVAEENDSANAEVEEIPTSIFSNIYKTPEGNTAGRILAADLASEEVLETNVQQAKSLKPLIEEMVPEPLDSSLHPSASPPEAVVNGVSHGIVPNYSIHTCKDTVCIHVHCNERTKPSGTDQALCSCPNPVPVQPFALPSHLAASSLSRTTYLHGVGLVNKTAHGSPFSLGDCCSSTGYHTLWMSFCVLKDRGRSCSLTGCTSSCSGPIRAYEGAAAHRISHVQV